MVLSTESKAGGAMADRKSLRRVIAVGFAAVLVALLAATPSFGKAADPTSESGRHEVEVTDDDPMSAGVAVYSRAWPLLHEDPAAWGDAYYDGDVLVINTVTRTVDEAAAFLAEHGIAGGFEIRQVQYSIADYDRAMDALQASGVARGKMTGMGPDYSEGVLRVSLVAGSGFRADDIRAAIEENWEGDPASIPPVVLEQGVFAQLASAAIEAPTNPWAWVIAAAVAVGVTLLVRRRARRGGRQPA